MIAFIIVTGMAVVAICAVIFVVVAAVIDPGID